MKAKDYQIVTTSHYTGDLANRVRDAIAQGWQPIGGVSHADGVLMQAMVKYVVKKPGYVGPLP